MNKLIYILIILFVTSCNSKDKEEDIKPTLRNITETVYASVKVQPELSYFPQPMRSGIIKEVFVKEGDTVIQGQELFHISIPANAENKLNNAKLNLNEAEANYKGRNNLLLNIESDIQAVKRQLVLDSTNFKRQERLWDQRIGKKIEYDRAKLTFENTQNQLYVLIQKKEQTIINLRNNYQRALSQTKTEYSDFADYTLRSEINGVIYSLNKEVGDFIGTQEKFAEIGSTKEFIVTMNIDEVDITKIHLQDSVVILLDAYPKKVFLAKVTKIYPKKDERTQTFRVESRFLPPIPQLYNGLSGEANIMVDKRKNTLVIPSTYLLTDNKVLTPEGEVSVKVGIKNLEFVEILSGIDTSTTLLLPSE